MSDGGDVPAAEISDPHAMPGRAEATPACSSATNSASLFVSAQLRRDREGLFKLVLREDAAGVYIGKLPPSDVKDDRVLLVEGDYVRCRSSS